MECRCSPCGPLALPAGAGSWRLAAGDWGSELALGLLARGRSPDALRTSGGWLKLASAGGAPQPRVVLRASAQQRPGWRALWGAYIYAFSSSASCKKFAAGPIVGERDATSGGPLGLPRVCPNGSQRTCRSELVRGSQRAAANLQEAAES